MDIDKLMERAAKLMEREAQLNERESKLMQREAAMNANGTGWGLPSDMFRAPGAGGLSITVNIAPAMASGRPASNGVSPADQKFEAAAELANRLGAGGSVKMPVKLAPAVVDAWLDS